jgi:uncharacterized membrane protein
MRSTTTGALAIVLGCLGAAFAPGCGEKVPPPPSGDAPAGGASGTGKGVLLVTGTGKDSYGLWDGKGGYVTSVKTNAEKELPAGPYSVRLGNRVEVAVKAGEKTTVAAGALVVTGTGKDSYGLWDGKGGYVTSVKTNDEREWMPGTYGVQMGNRPEVTVKGGEKTTVAAGTLLVTGTGKESYGLWDGKGGYVTSVKTNEEREWMPGTYRVQLGNKPEVAVKGGERTTLAAGTLLVTGTGKESYGLWDGSGGYVTSVKTNDEKELAPGTYAVQLGNRPEVAVKGGERTTLAAGTLLVTGAGTESCGLWDGKGGYVTSVKMNEEKELAPGSYTVKWKDKDHPVEVVGGQKTTLGL